MATCFHHEDRETGRACTRCGRPACSDCLIQASVGSQCFECVRAGRPKGTVRIRQTIERDPLIATKLLIAINVAIFAYIYLVDRTISGNGSTSATLGLTSFGLRNGEWWRVVTYSTVHFGIAHIGFNMLILWLVGKTFEPGTGPVRFTTIYLVSVLGGAAGALVASPHALTGGASGGIFGVAAAATLVMHRRGVRFWDTGFGPLLLLNLGLGFLEPNISIGGHIGGLIAGALTAEIMLRARKLEMPALGYLGAAVVGAAAIAISFAAATAAK
jgi:membrane associated rhomboid family serine protease